MRSLRKETQNYNFQVKDSCLQSEGITIHLLLDIALLYLRNINLPVYIFKLVLNTTCLLYHSIITEITIMSSFQILLQLRTGHGYK